MRNILFLILIVLSVSGCKKDIREDLEEKPGTITNPESAIVDSLYQTLEDLVADVAEYNSVKELIENGEWVTLYQRSVSVVQPSDTVYRKERPAGKDWRFLYYTMGPPNSGVLEISWDGNSLAMDFSLNGSQLILSQSEDYAIYDPTIYIDGSISFSLKYVQVLDSLQRIELIKLQSFR